MISWLRSSGPGDRTMKHIDTQRHDHLAVVPYTIDRETMQRAIDLGVDGIISDDPDLLLRVAKRNGLA